MLAYLIDLIYLCNRNNDTYESHPCICGTSLDVVISILDFKYKGMDSEMQTMFRVFSKSSLGLH